MQPEQNDLFATGRAKPVKYLSQDDRLPETFRRYIGEVSWEEPTDEPTPIKEWIISRALLRIGAALQRRKVEASNGMEQLVGDE
jgi:hypothetical protein